MKKQLLMKTFLVAVSMLVGTSAAWGASTTYVGSMYTYNVVFGTPNAATPTDINVQTDFTTDNTTKEQTTMSLVLTGSVLAGNQANGRTYGFSTAPTEGAVTFKSTFGVDAATYACDYFTIRGVVNNGTEDIESYAIVKSPTSLANATGTTTVLRIFSTDITANVYTPRSVLYGINVTIDITSQKVNYEVTYASKGSSGKVTGLNSLTGSVSVPDGFEIKSVADLYMPRNGQNRGCYYDNVAFYSAVPNSNNHSYTINAVAGGTIIKELATGSATEGDNYGTFLPKAILYNSQYYVLSDANVSNFYANFTMGDDDVTKEVTYTLNANMKAFWEGENMSYVGHNWYSNGNQTDNSGCSNGGAMCPYLGTSNGIRVNSTIASGVYDITIKPCRWGDAATDYTLQYSTDNANWTTVETVSFASTSNDAYVADNILIPGDSYLRLLSPSGTPRHAIDYIYVERTGDATVSKTITAAGWATYCSPYALDFTGDIANLTDVYIVTGANANSLELSSVKGGTVPANTGLLLEGAAGDVVIPIAGSSTTNVDANKLVGVTAETELAANGGYVLMRTPKVGFYQNANAFTVGANTAYLPANFAATARSFYSFGDATAIKAIDNSSTSEAAKPSARFAIDNYYNVAGQRVAAPTKGLYIQNGKKVVVK